jgi:hypothetical protein
MSSIETSGLLDNCVSGFQTYNYVIQFSKEIQQVKARRFITTLILILFLGTTACNLPSSAPATQDPYEAAAMTVTALAATEQAGQPIASATAMNTFAPPTSANTATSAPPLPTVAQVTATPSGTFFVVDVGANCRSGPGTNYDKVTSFAQGTFITLVGHNTDNSWWYVLTGSTNCWISASTGHTSGPTSALPLIAAPPTPTVAVTATTAGPKLSDPTALVSELSYPGTCTSNTLKVAIRVTDNGKGINSVWLSYRYLGDNGYTGSWHTVTPNDNAAGGINGFNYAIGAEADAELDGNGTVQYQFFAKDNSGNTSSYPSGSVLGLPIKYCP